jgi:hypothetical protein
MDRYFAAVGKLTKNANPVVQPLLIELKFFGYDNDGVLTTTPIVTKYIPIRMKDIITKFHGSAVVYNITAIANADAANYDSTNIKEPIEINATTVGEFFNNLADAPVVKVAKQYKDAPDFTAPIKSSIVTQGLAAVLNAKEKDLAEHNKGYIPDVYQFIIDSEIAKCKLAKTNDNTLLVRTSMTDSTTQKAVDLLPTNNKVNRGDRLYSLQSGISIQKVIEGMLHTSEFITRQQTIINDETRKVKEPIKQDPTSVLQWFMIGAKVELGEFDTTRHDYSKIYTWIIEPYNINSTKSPGFTPTTIKGIHKVYNYWFTGENTEVLHYEQIYNMMLKQTYASIQTGTDFVDMLGNANAVQTVDEYRASAYLTNRTGISTQNTEARAAQVAIDAATSLYNPTDLKETKITIFGDPSWMQTELYNTQGLTPRGPYTEDGSINGKITEVAVGIRFNISSDYNLVTGMQDYKDANNLTLGNSNIATKKTFDMAFMAKKVKSIFNNGKFTQELELGIMPKKEAEKAMAKVNDATPTKAEEKTDAVAVAPGNKLAPVDKAAPVPSLLQSKSTARQPTVTTRSAIASMVMAPGIGLNLADAKTQTVVDYHDGKGNVVLPSVPTLRK